MPATSIYAASVLSSDDRLRVEYWRPDSPAVTGMLRVENEHRVITSYAEHFSVGVVYEGAFDGWNRGAVRTHVAGTLKLNEPGEVHRGLRVHTPFTLQVAGFSPEVVAAAAAALGLSGPVHFKEPGFDGGERATRLAFAMHAALARADAQEMERATLVAETLSEVLAPNAASRGKRGGRAVRAVRSARALLRDAFADKISLDDLAEHAGLDKFHLVRAFRAEVGLPPYEYLTHVRVSRAKELLQRGMLVAQAAQAVGFCDESQLHRHFRRILGVTPGRFSRSFTGSERTSQHRPIGARAPAARSLA